MCEFKKVHENEFGYIVGCKSCMNYQLGLGNVLMKLNADKLDEITSVFQTILKKLKVKKREQKPILPDGREVVCKTPYENMALSFYEKELEDLIELLEIARLTREFEFLVAY